MTQKLEKYYGVRLKAYRDIERSKYEDAEREARAALESIPFRQQHLYGVYVTRLSFEIVKDEVFGVGPLHRRLDRVQLTLRINQKERDLRRMFFLNDRVPAERWLLTEGPRVESERFRIVSSLSGDFCQEVGLFETLVLTCVHRDVPERRRQIKIKASAYPTDQFKQRFHNIDGRFVTKLDHRLDKQVQLILKMT